MKRLGLLAAAGVLLFGGLFPLALGDDRTELLQSRDGQSNHEPTSGDALDPSKRDTVRVATVDALGANVVVPVYLFNSKKRLAGSLVSLKYGSDLVTCDSVSFADTRLVASEFRVAQVRLQEQVIQFTLLSVSGHNGDGDDEGDDGNEDEDNPLTHSVPPKDFGVLAFLHFRVTGAPSPSNHFAPIDTFLSVPLVVRFRGEKIDPVKHKQNAELRRATFVPGGINFLTSPVTRERDGALPKSFELFQNHPNPFNPSTTLRFAVPQTSRVELAVYNILGQKIRTLLDEVVPAGVYSTEWNGTDDAGMGAPSGIYFARFAAGSRVATQKMTLLK